MHFVVVVVISFCPLFTYSCSSFRSLCVSFFDSAVFVSFFFFFNAYIHRAILNEKNFSFVYFVRNRSGTPTCVLVSFSNVLYGVWVHLCCSATKIKCISSLFVALDFYSPSVYSINRICMKCFLSFEHEHRQVIPKWNFFLFFVLRSFLG